MHELHVGDPALQLAPVNAGAWANGSWPGWTSPNAQLLPEPLFISLPGYTCLVFAQVIFILWALRKIKAKRPGIGFLGTIGDHRRRPLRHSTPSSRSPCCRTGIYAYPGGIRELTLFAGETYQMPLTESFFFGGLGLGAIACLSYFRDDKGQTVVERGLDRVKAGVKQKQAIKFCAIFGAMHLAFLVLYMAPNQWLATHSDPFPKGYQSLHDQRHVRLGCRRQDLPRAGRADAPARRRPVLMVVR